MTPPPAATVAGRRVARETESEHAFRAPRRVAAPVREPEPRTRVRERARPATRPSSRATAAAVALEAALAPAPVRTRREAPAPVRPRREAPAPARPRRRAPARAIRPARGRTRTDHVPRLALRLQAPRLDRIVRGRAWIPVLGAMLVAIVGLRVAVLKLGASVGSQVQQATLLESSNTMLRTKISALSDNQRIEKLAAAYGMHMPNPLDAHFVSAAAGTHVQAAIHSISSPANSTYLSTLAAEQHHDEAVTQGTSSLSAVGVTTGVTAGTTGATTGSTGGTTSSTTGASTFSSTGATTGAGTTGSTTSTAGGPTSTGTGSTGTAAGTVQTASTTGTGSATQSTGASDLNTGVTNTDPGSSTAQKTATGTSGNGAAGLAG